MNNLELINKLYKPYRITKLSKCTIIDSLDGKFVIKPKGDKNIKEIYNYLKTRDFINFPNIIDSSRSDFNIFEYISGSDYPIEQRGEDLIRLVASLHSKTVYTKEVREDKFKEIYDNLKNNLDYYKKQYSDMVDKIEEEVFMSPSHYLYIRNSSKLIAQINFCTDRLSSWYDSVKDMRETRVCLLHNNLSLDHYIKNEDSEALISWDNSINDSPILDIYNLYQKEALNLDFNNLLKIYLKNFPLNKEELDLLLIMLCMPQDINLSKDEFISCEELTSILDYVFKTEELVKSYIEN